MLSVSLAGHGSSVKQEMHTNQRNNAIRRYSRRDAKLAEELEQMIFREVSRKIEASSVI